MEASVVDSKAGSSSKLLSVSVRGAWFGARFTFWFLVVFVTLPIAANVTAKVIDRPWRWKEIFLSQQGVVRYIIPAVGAPPAGAALGAAVAAVLFPLASLLDGRGSSGRWESYDESTSPFDDLPRTPSSREELLRRIVIQPPPELAKPA